MRKLYFILLAGLFFCGRAFAQNDLELRAIYPLDYATPGTWPFGTALFFHSTNSSAINYKICWQLDGGPVQTWNSPAQDPNYYVPGNNLRKIKSGSLKVTFPTPGIHELKVWAKITTSPWDLNFANDTFTKMVKVFSYLPPKEVVMETYKHQNCPPCYPAGIFIHNYMEPKPDYGIVNCYTLYPNEQLYNKVADTINKVYMLAHPQALYDRFKFPFYNHIYSDFIGGIPLDTEDRRYYVEPVEVSLPSVIVDNINHVLKVKVAARIYDTLHGEYRFNVFVTEDSVKAFQVDAPNPGNYYHQKVLRSMMGGAWGQTGSIPGTTLYPGQQFEYEFQVALPYGWGVTEWKQNKMSLVGLVQKYNDQDIYDRRILNSKHTTLFKALGVSTPQQWEDNLSVYPNPVTDELTVSKPGLDGVIHITDVTGRTIQTIEVKHRDEVKINTAGWAQGMYIMNYVGWDDVQIVRKIQK